MSPMEVVGTFTVINGWGEVSIRSLKIIIKV